MSTLLYRYLTTTWQPRVNRININAKKKTIPNLTVNQCYLN